MALSGLRDMSLIQTPPANRQPIKTKVIHWDRERNFTHARTGGGSSESATALKKTVASQH